MNVLMFVTGNQSFKEIEAQLDKISYIQKSPLIALCLGSIRMDCVKVNQDFVVEILFIIASNQR